MITQLDVHLCCWTVANYSSQLALWSQGRRNQHCTDSMLPKWRSGECRWIQGFSYLQLLRGLLEHKPFVRWQTPTWAIFNLLQGHWNISHLFFFFCKMTNTCSYVFISALRLEARVPDVLSEHPPNEQHPSSTALLYMGFCFKDTLFNTHYSGINIVLIVCSTVMWASIRLA